MLKKRVGYEWGAYFEQVFQELKQYLAAPPLLTTPKPGELLTLYLVVLEHAVSAALLRVRDVKQALVYYVSKTLLGVETRYLPLEKLALLTATRKLPHNFISHPVVVYTKFPLKALLRKADFLRRITTWSVELSQHEIDYQPRTVIKGQVLADFIAEFKPSALPLPPLREPILRDKGRAKATTEQEDPNAK